MSLVPDQRAIEEFVAAAPDPSLHDRVHPRDPDTAENNLDARVGENDVEQGGELPVAIADQEPRAGTCVFEVHDEVLRGLGDPRCGRVRGGAQDADPAAAVFDDREYVPAGAAQGRDFEEVTGQQSFGLETEKFGPSGEGAIGCRVDAGVLEDLPHRGCGDRDAEYEQFAVDATVAPRGVLPC